MGTNRKNDDFCDIERPCPGITEFDDFKSTTIASRKLLIFQGGVALFIGCVGGFYFYNSFSAAGITPTSTTTTTGEAIIAAVKGTTTGYVSSTAVETTNVVEPTAFLETRDCCGKGSKKADDDTSPPGVGGGGSPVDDSLSRQIAAEVLTLEKINPENFHEDFKSRFTEEKLKARTLKLKEDEILLGKKKEKLHELQKRVTEAETRVTEAETKTSSSSAFLQFGVATEGEPEVISEVKLLEEEETSVEELEGLVEALETSKSAEGDEAKGKTVVKLPAVEEKLTEVQEKLTKVKKHIAKDEAVLRVSFERIKALIQAYKRLEEVPFKNMKDPKTVTALLNAYEDKGRMKGHLLKIAEAKTSIAAARTSIAEAKKKTSSIETQGGEEDEDAVADTEKKDAKKEAFADLKQAAIAALATLGVSMSNLEQAMMQKLPDTVKDLEDKVAEAEDKVADAAPKVARVLAFWQKEETKRFNEFKEVAKKDEEEAAKPAVKKEEAANPDVKKEGAAKPAVKKEEAAESDVKEEEAAERDVKKKGAAERVVKKKGAAERDVKKERAAF